MNFISKIKVMIREPLWLIVFFNNRGVHLLNDEKYIRLLYKLQFKKEINLENPQTFNEKLQWLKLYDRNPEYTKMVDKYEAKKYVSNIIGEEYIISTLGVWEKFEEIDFNLLPNQFVLKCTHDSGGLIICKDKNILNIKSSKKLINKCLKNKFYYSGREWPYKNVKPRIIVEKYMENNSGEEIIDYKLFCFNGVPRIILVCSERFSSKNMCETWFDEDWNYLDITENNHRTDKTIKCPINFDEMKILARKLSDGIPFLRCDFYEVNEKIYFGELTFFPASGFEKFEPNEWDKKLGDMLELPKERKVEK